MQPSGAIRLIVAGVDGSRPSVAALRWAAAQALAQRCELTAVRAWHPRCSTAAPYAPLTRLPSPAQEREAATESLAAAVHEVSAAMPELKIQQVIAQGPAAHVLLSQAEKADLLVLGGRLRDTPIAPAVGSVAAACLRHAPCPVVMVPPAATPVPRQPSLHEPVWVPAAAQPVRATTGR